MLYHVLCFEFMEEEEGGMFEDKDNGKRYGRSLNFGHFVGFCIKDF